MASRRSRSPGSPPLAPRPARRHRAPPGSARSWPGPTRFPAGSTPDRCGEGSRSRRGGIRGSASAFPPFPVGFPEAFALANRFALVVELLALHQSDLDFHSRALEVELQRNAGHARARDGLGPAVELPAVEEHLAVALGAVARPRGGSVWRDVRSDQVRLPVAKLDERVLQVGSSFAKRFHLAPDEGEPRLHALLDEVVVMRLAIRRDDAGLAGGAARHPEDFGAARNSRNRMARSGSNCVPAFETMMSSAVAGSTVAR